VIHRKGAKDAKENGKMSKHFATPQKPGSGDKHSMFQTFFKNSFWKFFAPFAPWR